MEASSFHGLDDVSSSINRCLRRQRRGHLNGDYNRCCADTYGTDNTNTDDYRTNADGRGGNDSRSPKGPPHSRGAL